jgi:hypothetical protein
MRRRLYFLALDVIRSREVVNELLVAHIEAQHIHVLARRDTDLGDLPGASALQKTDLAHAAQTGMVLGWTLGILAGVILLLFPIFDTPPAPGLLLGTALLGAVFGAWTASLAGLAVPNSRLARFQEAIEGGRLLLMVDVPFGRVAELSELVRTRHAQALSGGFEPTIPAFP